MDLRRLILSFVGFALVILTLFGLFAYRIADETSKKQELAIADAMAEEQAKQLGLRLQQGHTAREVVIESNISSSHILLVLVGEDGRSLVDFPGDLSPWKLAVLATTPNFHSQSMTAHLEIDRFHIARAQHPIANTPYTLHLFLHYLDVSQSWYQSLGVRLVITGLIVIWIAVWGAIILFGIVTRKTNKLTQARKQSDEQVRLLLDSTAEAIFGIDTEGRCTFCNPMTVEMLGYRSDAQLLGRDVHALMHHTRPDGSPYPESECRICEVFSSGQGVHCDDEVFWRADGSSFPVVYRGHPVRRDGDIVGAVVTFLDISEKLYKEHEMHKLSQVVEQASDAVFITNSAGIIEYLNPSFERLTGYTRAELVDTKSSMISRAYQENAPNREMIAKLKKGEVYTGVRVHTRKDGDEFYAQETAAPLRNANGDTTHLVYTFNDISRQLEQEANIQSIIVQKQNAEQASLEKSSFLANVSHELRTPLNAIIGYSELLEEELRTTADKVFIEDAKKINTAGYHLLALINDILDFSKIEAGKLELYTEEIPLKSLLQEVITIMHPMMEKGRNQFIHNIDPDPGAMFVDVTRLRQCLLNLLSNAAKFTERGTVTLTVRKYSKQGQEWILFIVSDTGVGIAAEKIPKLFGEFVQVESSTNRGYSGVGLGLAISRRLVRLMGGDITVESEPGKGANFTINMPVVVKIQDDNDNAQQAIAS